jgi:DNA-binding CsgD family transcriptional regulator
MSGDSLAFPWARTYDADQLAAFIEDLWGAASGDNDLATLDAVEKVIAEHRPGGVVPQGCPLTEMLLAIIIEGANGVGPRATASRLGISHVTVYKRRERAYERLGVRSLGQAIAVCMAHRWIPRDALILPDLPGGSFAPGRGVQEARAARLRGQPGTWQPIGTYGSRRSAQVAASRIRTGTIAAFQPRGAYEAQPYIDDGTHTVRARYIANATQKAAS